MNLLLKVVCECLYVPNQTKNFPLDLQKVAEMLIFFVPMYNDL